MPVLSTQAPAKVPDHSEAHCLLCWTPRPQRFTQEILLLMLTVEDHHRMFPHDVPAGELRSVACLEYAAPVRGRAGAAVRQWFALSNLWVGWGGMLGRFGGSGQYSLRFAASSDSTSSRKSHRSQSGQLCSTLDPQSPTICPVDTVACASRNTLPLNVCLEICVPQNDVWFLHGMCGPRKRQCGIGFPATGLLHSICGLGGAGGSLQPMQLQNWPCEGRVHYGHCGANLQTAPEEGLKKEQWQLSL